MLEKYIMGLKFNVKVSAENYGKRKKTFFVSHFLFVETKVSRNSRTILFRVFFNDISKRNFFSKLIILTYAWIFLFQLL
jgi:hypothetical protein